MKRRAVLAGGSALVLGRYASAQPIPLGGAVGSQDRPPGPQPVGGAPPSLSLDFTTGPPLDPRITFTRASTATYFDATGTMRTATANTPRFDYDPVTHAARGLLIEEQRQNVLNVSSDLTQAYWTKAGQVAAAPTVTGNQTTAPDGTLTASRIVYPAVSGATAFSLVYASYPASAAVYAYSVYLKGAVGGEQVYISASTGGTAFYSSPRLTLTTQWQRFSVVTSALTAVAWIFDIGTDLRDVTQASTTSQTIYAWGAQLELGAFSTSYIPTTAGAVTRAIDLCSMPVAAWYNQAVGSMQFEYMLEGYTPGFGAPCAFVGAAVGTDYIDMDQFTSTGATGVSPVIAGAGILAGGAGGGNATFSATIPTPINVVHKGAAAWNVGSLMGTAHDAQLATTVTTVTTLPVVVNLLFGGSFHFQPAADLWARRFRYWPRGLSNVELVGVTT